MRSTAGLPSVSVRAYATACSARRSTWPTGISTKWRMPADSSRCAASAEAAQRLLSAGIRHFVLIPVGHVDRRALQAVAYARTLTDGSPAVDRIEAVYVTDDLSAGERLRDHWEDLRTGVPMVILDSPYRATAEALLKYLSVVQKREPPHTFVTVLLPEIQPTRWWHPLVHNYLAWRLKWLLLFHRGTAV